MVGWAACVWVYLVVGGGSHSSSASSACASLYFFCFHGTWMDPCMTHGSHIVADKHFGENVSVAATQCSSGWWDI
eukprot:scaffold5229_cov102-Isochrysis_galbana.AAC.3